MAHYKTLFEAHAGANLEIAKSALDAVIRKNITKHVKLQSLMTKTLLMGDNENLLYNIEKLANKMLKYNNIVGELCSSWNTLFDEEYDSQKAVIEACEEWYPTAANKEAFNPYKRKESTKAVVNISGSDGDVETIIREALEGKLPGNIKVQMVNTERAIDEAIRVLGINPGDYGNFNDFFTAVKVEMARRKAEGTLGEVSDELTTLIERGKDIVEKAFSTPITDKAVKKADSKKKPITNA